MAAGLRARCRRCEARRRGRRPPPRTCNGVASRASPHAAPVRASAAAGLGRARGGLEGAAHGWHGMAWHGVAWRGVAWHVRRRTGSTRRARRRSPRAAAGSRRRAASPAGRGHGRWTRKVDTSPAQRNPRPTLQHSARTLLIWSPGGAARRRRPRGSRSRRAGRAWPAAGRRRSRTCEGGWRRRGGVEQSMQDHHVAAPRMRSTAYAALQRMMVYIDVYSVCGGAPVAVARVRPQPKQVDVEGLPHRAEQCDPFRSAPLIRSTLHIMLVMVPRRLAHRVWPRDGEDHRSER